MSQLNTTFRSHFMRMALPLIALCWAASAPASTMVGGVAVDSAGSSTMVGSTQSVTHIPDAIKYYIPLSASQKGTYGVAGTPAPCTNGYPGTFGGAGTCADSGIGYGYSDSSALQMNIFFDMAGLPESQSAELSFLFDDLDLTPENDPDGFFESISLSYWNWNTGNNAFDATPVSVTGTLTAAGVSPDPEVDAGDPNLITWDLDLLALGALNASAQAQDGFWIQLGFGSKYVRTHSDGSIKYDSHGNEIPKNGTNTPEYLSAELTVSPVPVPAAVWLFGTALIGFVGMSRRTKVS
ncbi:MAG: VPLPA-CTERM sorting domain-containing protein [Gammaproteobacteria bacterium]|nr:VPLPA-CTERM sorting domain-containing protein [Gammaproteobacteria bacterium]